MLSRKAFGMLRSVLKPKKNDETGMYEVGLVFDRATDASFLRFWSRDEAWKCYGKIEKEGKSDV